jgi:uncharacterized Fe-S center protein
MTEPHGDKKHGSAAAGEPGAPAPGAAPAGAQDAAGGPGAGSAGPVTVWFAPVRTAGKESLVTRCGKLAERAGLRDVIAKDDFVAIKLHFGETGNTGFLSPIFAREVVRLVKEAGGRPFLTDANTLYTGKRANAVDHIACAIHHGFSFATVDAPIIIADGLDGRDSVEVPIAGSRHFETVRIGAAVMHADALVVMTHVKGHELTGLGGAFKNVGMGLGSRSAKQRMHADFEPSIIGDKCTRCGRCVEGCSVAAMTMDHDSAVVDLEICIGCGECVARCAYGAIDTQWKTDPQVAQEKIVDHAAAVLEAKKNKVLYLSFITNVTPDCDCWDFSDAPLVADIGVLASLDPVAIDQAAYDLVVAAPGAAGGRGEGMAAGEDKFVKVTGIDGSRTLEYAEERGLGTRCYELKTLR